MSAVAGSHSSFDFSRLPRKLRDLPRWLFARGVPSRGQKKRGAFTLQNKKAHLADHCCMASFTAVRDAFERNPGLFDAPAIVLGKIGDGIYLGTIDLHDCIGEVGDIADWAQRILDLCETYAEQSFFSRRIRLFFFASAEAVRAAPIWFGYPANQWGFRRVIDANSAAVAISFANDFAAVTGRALPDRSADIAQLDETLLRQLALLMPGVASKTEDASPKPIRSKLEKREHVEADREQISQFVDSVFRYTEEGSWVSLRIFDQFDHTMPPLHIEGVRLTGDGAALVDAAIRVATRGANMTEPAVFAPPIATFENATHARSVDIFNGLTISVDIDEGDTYRALNRLEQLLGPATMVVASGGTTSEGTPKLHAHWRLNEPTRDAEGHQTLQRARRSAALLVGADPTGAPPAHPYRWPCGWHRKNDPPVMARIIAANPEAEIDLDETIERLEDAVEAAGLREANARAPKSGESQQHPELLWQWVAAIPNNDVHYKVWVDWGYACFHAFGEEPGFEPWEALSKKSAKYNAANQATTWKRIKAACAGTKPHRTIGAGTLCKLAQAAGWKWSKEAVRLKEEWALQRKINAILDADSSFAALWFGDPNDAMLTHALSARAFSEGEITVALRVRPRPSPVSPPPEDEQGGRLPPTPPPPPPGVKPGSGNGQDPPPDPEPAPECKTEPYGPPTEADFIASLAALDELAYARIRDAKAAQLGVDVPALNKRISQARRDAKAAAKVQQKAEDDARKAQDKAESDARKAREAAKAKAEADAKRASEKAEKQAAADAKAAKKKADAEAKARKRAAKAAEAAHKKKQRQARRDSQDDGLGNWISTAPGYTARDHRGRRRTPCRHRCRPARHGRRPRAVLCARQGFSPGLPRQDEAVQR